MVGLTESPLDTGQPALSDEEALESTERPEVGLIAARCGHTALESPEHAASKKKRLRSTKQYTYTEAAKHMGDSELANGDRDVNAPKPGKAPRCVSLTCVAVCFALACLKGLL